MYKKKLLNKIELLNRIDIHIHGAPDLCLRLLDNEEIVQAALTHKLKGIVLKSHGYETVRFAKSFYDEMGHRFVFGSYVMNSGFSCSQIEFAKQIIKRGAAILYLPTIQAENHYKMIGKKGGFSVLYKRRLVPGLEDLFAYMSEKRTTLATGHISKTELDVVLESAKKHQLATVLIVHPEYYINYLSKNEQIEIRKEFLNVLFERTCYSVLLNDPKRLHVKSLSIDKKKLEELINNIYEIGSEFSVLSSDLGQPFNLHPVTGFKEFLQLLYNQGISKQSLDWMTKANPMRVVGLWEDYLEEIVKLEYKKFICKYKTPYRAPLLGFADANNHLFISLKKLVGKHHLLPKDIFSKAKSVISLFQPFGIKLVRENARGKIPTKEWCLAYTETNKLLDLLTESLKCFIGRMGFGSERHSVFHHLSDKHDRNIKVTYMTSKWSQRHIAYIAGLGTFGLNNMLITSKGCAGRYSSLVTNMKLFPSSRPDKEYCLMKQGINCGYCRKICPSGALREANFDYLKCWRYLIDQNRISEENKMPIVNVCGKCMSGAPCSIRRPGK